MKPPGQLPRSVRVLLLIDFINPLDFPEAAELAPMALRAAQAAARLRRRLDREGVPTIYANDNFGHWDSEFRKQVATVTKAGGIPGRMVRALRPRKRDLAILKPRHSAFFASPLDVLMQAMGAKQLVLAGLATDMCVQLTAMDAFLRDYRVWVPSDCTAANSEAAKAKALGYMRDVLRCDVSPAQP